MEKKSPCGALLYVSAQQLGTHGTAGLLSVNRRNSACYRKDLQHQPEATAQAVQGYVQGLVSGSSGL